MVHVGYCGVIVAAALVSTSYAGGGATIARTSLPDTHAIVARLFNSTLLDTSRGEVAPTTQANSKRAIPPPTGWNARMEQGEKRIFALEDKLGICFKPPTDPSTTSTCHDETLTKIPTDLGYEIRGADKEALPLSQLLSEQRMTWTATNELIHMGLPATTLFKEMDLFRMEETIKGKTIERFMMKMFISVDDSMEKKGAVVRESAYWRAVDRDDNKVFPSNVMMEMIRMVRGPRSLENIEFFVIGALGNIDTMYLLDHCHTSLLGLHGNRQDLHTRPEALTLDVDNLYTETQSTITTLENECLKALSGSVNAYGYFRLLTDFPKQFGLKRVRYLHVSNTVVFRLEKYADFRNRKVSTS